MAHNNLVLEVPLGSWGGTKPKVAQIVMYKKVLCGKRFWSKNKNLSESLLSSKDINLALWLMEEMFQKEVDNPQGSIVK